MAVAPMASLMMNLEKVFCRLKAIRLAMKTETFKRRNFCYLTNVFYLNVLKITWEKLKFAMRYKSAMQQC